MASEGRVLVSLNKSIRGGLCCILIIIPVFFYDARIILVGYDLGTGLAVNEEIIDLD